MAERKRKGPKAAVALGYSAGVDPAPRVLAAGRGEIAQQILEAASRHGVPVYQDHPLAQALVRLEVGAQVPPELYAAVAEVLAFLWRIEQQKAAREEQGR